MVYKKHKNLKFSLLGLTPRGISCLPKISSALAQYGIAGHKLQIEYQKLEIRNENQKIVMLGYDREDKAKDERIMVVEQEIDGKKRNVFHISFVAFSFMSFLFMELQSFISQIYSKKRKEKPMKTNE